MKVLYRICNAIQVIDCKSAGYYDSLLTISLSVMLQHVQVFSRFSEKLSRRSDFSFKFTAIKFA